MEILFVTHPRFFSSQSMPRFATMLAENMEERGNEVSLFYPKPVFYRLPLPTVCRKWMGYIDQYILFPWQLRKQIKKRKNALVVFTDHALGPWIPLAKNRPHAIHCHDFLSQLSALGKIKENPTGLTGRLYQAYIRRGFTKGKYFISVSYKTQSDLHHFLPVEPLLSKVVYNGLNQHFSFYPPMEAKVLFGNRIKKDLSAGYILHLGGCTWYKNRRGVIEIYNAWRRQSDLKLPLLIIGNSCNNSFRDYETSPYKKDIHLLPDIEDEYINYAYSGASVFLFPSLAEGFGWPIAEAMACGCPVITTGEAPMTEVAGNAGFFIERRPCDEEKAAAWAEQSAKMITKVINFTEAERSAAVKEGLLNAKRFETKAALDAVEKIYDDILHTSEGQTSRLTANQFNETRTSVL